MIVTGILVIRIMLIEKKHIILNNALFILLDAQSPLDLERQKKKYGRLSIISYHNLDLENFELRKRKTLLIDLANMNRKREEIFRDFNSQTKNKINRTERTEGLEFICPDSNFEQNYSLYYDFEYSQSRVPEKRSYFLDNKTLFFSSYYYSQIIANVGCFNVDDKALRVINISSKRLETNDRELYKTISCASRRIFWEICKYGLDNGYRWLDLCGVNFKDPQKRGITEFKMGFGGRIIEENTYTYKNYIYKLIEKPLKIKLGIIKFLKG